MPVWRDVLICTVGASLKGNLARQADPGCWQDLERGYAKGLAHKILAQNPDDMMEQIAARY